MNEPLVSFCISTYKRPEFLKKQITSLLTQSFPYFNIVISDNDPDCSANDVAESFKDTRVKYFHNGENLGMMKSFNRSIERAQSDYIVMVTDDDPVDSNFLADFYKWHKKLPGYSVYGGFSRKKKIGNLEIIESNDFLTEVLDPGKTSKILWSSCVMERKSVLQVGKIPDYESPHLADHALIVMAGSIRGGVVINKMYSSLNSHDANFSKFNFQYYIVGCEGFFKTLTNFCKKNEQFNKQRNIIIKHLGAWFVTSVFTLKKYYTIKNYDLNKLIEIDLYKDKILAFPFMRTFKNKIYFKQAIFLIKRRLNLLK